MQPRPPRPADPPDIDWEHLYDAHAARLVLYARQWLPDRASAEDAVQGGFVRFIRACRNRPATDAATTADVPLLFTAVRSEAIDIAKGAARRNAREQRAPVDDAWWNDDPLVCRERQGAVRAALDALPIEQREVVVLRIWGDLTFADIARTLETNENTVVARCRRAFATLERVLPEVCREPLS